jgi:cysteine desulfurase
MCFKGVEGESLMILLDEKGIQISTGSACNSASLLPPATLTAIGFNEADIHSCIRITFSGEETKSELDYVCQEISKSVMQLRSLNM